MVFLRGIPMLQGSHCADESEALWVMGVRIPSDFPSQPLATER